MSRHPIQIKKDVVVNDASIHIPRPLPVLRPSAVIDGISDADKLIPVATKVNPRPEEDVDVRFNLYAAGQEPHVGLAVGAASYILGPKIRESRTFQIDALAPAEYERFSIAAGATKHKASTGATTLLADDTQEIAVISEVARLFTASEASTGYRTLDLSIEGTSEAVNVAFKEDDAAFRYRFGDLEFLLSGQASELQSAANPVIYYTTETEPVVPSGLAAAQEVFVTRFLFGAQTPAPSARLYVSSKGRKIYSQKGCDANRTHVTVHEILNPEQVHAWYSQEVSVPNVAFFIEEIKPCPKSHPTKDHRKETLVFVVSDGLTLESAISNASTRVLGFAEAVNAAGESFQQRSLLRPVVASKFDEERLLKDRLLKNRQ